MPYTDPSDKTVMGERFTKAHERFIARMKERNEDKKLDTAWKAGAYFARKGLREAALTRRPSRKRRAK